MSIEQSVIVKILPTKCWLKYGMGGGVSIMLQHDGMKPFEFVRINYNYAYTSNSHRTKLAEDIATKLLGYELSDAPNA